MKTDFSTVSVGDRVRLTGNDEIHEFVVSDVNQHTIGSQHAMFAIDEGWTVEILEHAEPELPKESGFYAGANNTAWCLNSSGTWFGSGTEGPHENPEDYAPFTRLVPAASDD